MENHPAVQVAAYSSVAFQEEDSFLEVVPFREAALVAKSAFDDAGK